MVNIKESAIEKFMNVFSEPGAIRVITHLDTDGLTSAAIMASVLESKDQQFWLSNVKQLEDSMIKKLAEQTKTKKWKALVFLDLGSSKIGQIKKISDDVPVFVIDHHELDASFDLASESSSGNFYFMHSGSEKISAAGLTYLFVKKLGADKGLSQLAVLGMIGDMLDKHMGKESSLILEDAKNSGMQVRRGLTVFSSMRPVHKALEFSSNVFIPGVTGSANGALSMLRDIGIDVKKPRGYRTMLDLTKDELSRLITSVLVKRVSNGHNQEIIDNIYLIKVAGNLWDAREVSTMLNACGRLDYGNVALAFLLGSREAKEEVENIYSQYKHHLIQALNWMDSAKKVEGEKFIIVNAKSSIKDTIIGTVISIMASSFLYTEGTILVGLAYRQDNKIKVSARIVKDRTKANAGSDINLYTMLNSVIGTIGGEVGGHANAAGGLILQDKEKVFLELLEKKLSMDEIKISA